MKKFKLFKKNKYQGNLSTKIQSVTDTNNHSLKVSKEAKDCSISPPSGSENTKSINQKNFVMKKDAINDEKKVIK